MLPISSSASAGFSAHWNPQAVRYPLAHRLPNTFDRFESKKEGYVDIPDPYRWLEQTTPTSKNSEEVEEFLASQEALTKSYLRKYSYRDHLQNILTHNMDYAKFSSPKLQPDGYYYFTFNSGLQPQAMLYRVRQGYEEAELSRAGPKEPGGELFIDPNLFSHDGASALSTYSFSKSGEYVAYMVTHAGSDLQTIHVRRSDTPHLRSAKDGGRRGGDPGRMADIIANVKYSCLSWLKDDSGFLYSKYPDDAQRALSNHQLFFHRLGDHPSRDMLILEDHDNPLYRWDAEVTGDGKYIILSIRKDRSASCLVWVADLTSQPLSRNMRWRKIVNEFGNQYTFHGNDDTRLYFKTFKDAPKGKIVTFDLRKSRDKFEVLIPEKTDAVLETFHATNSKFAVLEYTKHSINELYLHDLGSGKRITQIGKALFGKIHTITGGRNHREFFFSFNDYVNPGTVYRYRFDQGLSEYRTSVVPGLNPDDFESKQVFYESKDGTRIPMILVHRKDFRRDGTAPCLQHGYGGFGYSLTPSFTPLFINFVAQFGGILAVPNLRGGGEYGKEWHLAGNLKNKQKSFDDFQYATKYLVANRYAAAHKVTIHGASNGGLLVAACVNQAPQLYRAAIAQVGLLDMLKFPQYTIGHQYISEYGNPNDPKDFDYLKKYSPLHNINKNAIYPALMVVGADQDDKVVPSHSYKYIAAIQHALPNNPNPLLLNVEKNTGHFFGKSTEAQIQSAFDQLTFIALSQGLRLKPYSDSS